jgi:hypothetical protein
MDAAFGRTEQAVGHCSRPDLEEHRAAIGCQPAAHAISKLG